MKLLNPELESQIDSLAEVCCKTLNRTIADSVAEAEPLIEALVRGGYARLSDMNLQHRVELGAVAKCPEVAIHRRGELAAITREMQQAFDLLVTRNTRTPANTSTLATDA